MITLAAYDSVYPLPRPSSPPPDLGNLAFLEDARSRVGELAQLARADASRVSAEEICGFMKFIDRLEGVHDYLVRLSLEAKRKEAAL